MGLDIVNYKFTIKLLSGTHIGAGDTEMRIGGVDNKVIRNPVDDMPYIPGSSLKGKVRSLLEYRTGIKSSNPYSGRDMGKNGEIGKEIDTIVKLFGAGGSDKGNSGVTRLSFADAYLSENDKKRNRDNLFEVKAETAINRKTGTAQNPRFTERVAAGLEFIASISMKVFENDKQEEFEATLFKGLKLLTLDAIGGYGSRGYGRVEITFVDEELRIDEKLQEEFNKIQLFKEKQL